MTIYALTNSSTGKTYVGQTTTPLCKRFASHKWRAGKEGRGFALSAAMKKYGVETFEIESLQQCRNQVELDAAELLWIERLNTLAPNGYNIRLGGSHGKHNESTKTKLRARIFTPEWRARISAAAKRRKATPEQRQRQSERQTGRKISEEMRLRVYVGENNPRAKLKREQVDEIRALYKKGGISQEAIAAKYGVTQTAIGFIVRGVHWK
jgi:group I intron endonuclease